MNKRSNTLLAMAILLLTSPSAYALDDGLYAVLHTSMGSVTAQLYYAEAPMTVANFIGLAEGTQAWMDTETGAVHEKPFYDGVIFHRVISGFMIQTGSRNQLGTDGPGYRFPDEIPNGLQHDSAGILSMANSGLDSNGSQFFITVTNTWWLDGAHTVFGRVIDGQAVVQSINSVDTDEEDRPLDDVINESIDIVRIGTDAEAFDGADLLPVVQEGRIDDIALTGTGLEMTFEPASFHAYHLRSSFDLSTWSVTNLIRYADNAPETEPIIRGTNMAARAFYALVEMDFPGNQYAAQSLNNRWIEFEFQAPEAFANLTVRYDLSIGVGNEVTRNGEPHGSINAGSYQFLLYPHRSHLIVIGDPLLDTTIFPSTRYDYRLSFTSLTNGTFSAIKRITPSINQITGTFTVSQGQ